MKSRRAIPSFLLSFAVFLSSMTATTGHAALDAGFESRIQDVARTIAAGQTIEAIDELEVMLRLRPDDGRVHGLLGHAFHLEGDYEAALDHALRAATDPSTNPDGLYNAACAAARLGRMDDAYRHLQAAIEAGFADLDLVESDPDLDALRDDYEVALPPRLDYEHFRGHNGVEMAYHVFGAENTEDAPVVVFFPPGNGPRTADGFVDGWIGDTVMRDWTVVVLVAPERGWFTHPTHHALEDLLDELRESLQPRGGVFHVAGLGPGARAATTYAAMSQRYFASLTTFGGSHWSRWDDRELRQGFGGIAVRMIVGEKDTLAREQSESAIDLIRSGGARAELEIVDGENVALRGLGEGRFLDHLQFERNESH